MVMAVLKKRVDRRLLVALALLFGAGLFAGACFNPNQPACAFSCAEAGVCPDGYSCGADKICHKVGATGVCPLGDGSAGPFDAAPQD
jgi:hypothetical protein